MEETVFTRKDETVTYTFFLAERVTKKWVKNHKIIANYFWKFFVFLDTIFINVPEYFINRKKYSMYDSLLEMIKNNLNTHYRT